MVRRVVLALSLVAACSKSGRDPAADCLQGNAALGIGASDPRRVIAVCERAGRDPEVQAALARAYLIARDPAHVIALAETARGSTAARIWHLAGEASLQRGDHDGARAWYQRALDGARDRDPRRASNSASRLADLARADGRVDEAIRDLDVALALAARSGDPGVRTLSAIGLVDLLLSVGEDRAAREVLDSVADAADAPASEPFRREYLLAVGDLELRAGRHDAAVAAYQRCLDDLATIDPLTAYRCELGLADLAGDPARREALLSSAAGRIAAVDASYGIGAELRGEIALGRAQLAAAAGRADEAEASLRTLVDLPIGAALRSRAGVALGRLLADRGRADDADAMLASAAAAVEQLRDGAHYGETRRANPDELRAPYEQLFVLRTARGDLDGAVAAMEHALDRDFIDQLTAGPPAVAGAHPAPDLAAAAQRTRARRLLDARASARSPRDAGAPAPAPDAATIAFFSAAGALWRVTDLGGRRRIDRVALLADLAADLAAVRIDPTDDAAARVGALLFPADRLPPDGATIVVVPDRALYGLHVAALRDRRGAYLIEHHPLALAPSLRLAGADPSPTGAPAVVLGDPDGSLPASHDEASAVAGLLHVAPRLGAAADRAALATARDAAVLHVASHGATDGARDVLHLADGDVDAADIVDLGLAPRLAVVASCASATQHADAMWTSVAAGLLAAGTRGVIGALGSIPDDAARALVLDVYAGDLAHPAEALARAQRAAIARGVPVRVWSTLVYFGPADR